MLGPWVQTLRGTKGRNWFFSWDEVSASCWEIQNPGMSNITYQKELGKSFSFWVSWVCVCMFIFSWNHRFLENCFSYLFLAMLVGSDLLNFRDFQHFSFVSLMWSEDEKHCAMGLWKISCLSLYVICSGIRSMAFISFTKWFVIPSP